WFSVWGLPMQPEEWTDPKVRVIAALIDGRFVPEGKPCDSVLLLFNSSDEDVQFTLPQVPMAKREWRVRVDTSDDASLAGTRRIPHEEKYELAAHAMAVLTQRAEDASDAMPS
ncbi:MAG TPA: hypothetical protein VL593_06535, partial [Ramlibacter sp.]|nr:hypothetical protein [Ramlibacter sp.]